MVHRTKLLRRSPISHCSPTHKIITQPTRALYTQQSHRSRLHAMSTQEDLSSQIQALSKYTACDIADALVKLKVPNAGFLPDLHLRSPSSGQGDGKVTIAPASTVLFAWKDGSHASDLPVSNIPDNEHWVDLTQKGTIVVMSQPGDQKCAVLGGIMALRIKVLHGQGIVVHGRVRDISELQETGLPIWSNATSIIGTGLEAKAHAVQVPLNLKGTIVKPGDLVFSDPANGVVIVPHEKVAEVIDHLPAMIAADDRVKQDVASGVSVREAFQKHRGQ